jgi:hypothetical protein
MLTSARLTLKHHRFEIGAAVLGALVLAISALVVAWRLNAIGVPAGCFEAWLNGGGAAGAGDCAGPVQAFATINEEEAGKVLAAMAVLPFAVGLLAGVPLVGRELEARTAQTAWFLNGSRLRWLGRQLLPVLVLVVVAVTFAALAADRLEETRAPWYHSAIGDMALHGPIVVARALAGLGVGLLVGALVGRTLPAFILGALAALVVVNFVAGLQFDWFHSHAQLVIASNDGAGFGDGLQFEQVWIGPDGSRIDDIDLSTKVPPEHAADPYDWLVGQGFRQGFFGLSANVALGWIRYDVAIFSTLGVVGAAGAAFVVTRRRPT